MVGSVTEKLVETIVLLDVRATIELAEIELGIANVSELVDPVVLLYVKVEGVE